MEESLCLSGSVGMAIGMTPVRDPFKDYYRLIDEIREKDYEMYQFLIESGCTAPSCGVYCEDCGDG